jgi:hypothetical protein
VDDNDALSAETAVAPRRVDYAGAVYGSLLAASVITGSATTEHSPSPWSLVALLLATGLVYWMAHAYAGFVGDREHGVGLSWAELRAVGAREWPLVQAAFPPAAAAAVGGLVGLADSTVAWAALFTAVAGQVGWSVVATAHSGAGRRLVVASAIANLLLGLLLVALKTRLAH